MILRKAYALCILLLCLCLLSAGAASAEETYASLAEKLGGKVICTACGEDDFFTVENLYQHLKVYFFRFEARETESTIPISASSITSDVPP